MHTTSGPMSAPVEAAGLFPPEGHDHSTCRLALMSRAARLFATHGLKLTEPRRRVLAEIADSHQALGAYQLLERLAAKGRRPAPVSVYRAIEALHAVGLVHRLESRNAFFACHADHAPDRDQVVLACERCGQVAEVDGAEVFAALDRATARAAFAPRRATTEVVGECAACRAAASRAETAVPNTSKKRGSR